MFARLSIFEDLDLSGFHTTSEWMAAEGLRLSRELPGYQGQMTLVDRDGRRLVGIGLYDNEENMRKANEIMNGPPPESMPEELKKELPKRSFVGLFEVIGRDGT